MTKRTGRGFKRTYEPVAASGNPLARHTPAGRWTTAISRSPGSRLDASRHLPRPKDPVVFDVRHTVYSCGGSPGFTPEFPFSSPRRGTYRAAQRCCKTPCASNSEGAAFTGLSCAQGHHVEAHDPGGHCGRWYGPISSRRPSGISYGLHSCRLQCS